MGTLVKGETWTGPLFGRIVPTNADVAEPPADASLWFPSLKDGDKAIIATALVTGYGVATGSVPVLSTTMVVIFSIPRSIGVLDRDTKPGTASAADPDRTDP